MKHLVACVVRDFDGAWRCTAVGLQTDRQTEGEAC